MTNRGFLNAGGTRVRVRLQEPSCVASSVASQRRQTLRGSPARSPSSSGGATGYAGYAPAYPAGLGSYHVCIRISRKRRRKNAYEYMRAERASSIRTQETGHEPVSERGPRSPCGQATGDVSASIARVESPSSIA
jgi:hypothetical protein